MPPLQSERQRSKDLHHASRLHSLPDFRAPYESVSVQSACDALFWGTGMPEFPLQASIEKEEYFSQAGGKMYQGGLARDTKTALGDTTMSHLGP